ncbi:TPA: fibronectin binding protein [Streptococcus pyogenes]|uniref:Fibronectin binding protein SfbX n=2 Tax=Streptococcus pyogenes TaxID=1314 RepID=Q934I3_STRPY|nr:LPXTG cell wall anchor domain-containing protein [Streptococcus pyogenes]ABF36812.1 Fibronectin-binding protein [Streptococcus pyogenes MGAS2096]HEP6204632.1 fibronectin binding protein [Streptococcus pyogenes ABC020040632]HEP6206323.1 fibronectin binding protein [Streptococcus pyogenes ABC020016604]HEP6290515.1 fibronectin binding protein [Streptococcus pyogenes ABC020038314]HEP6317074.1 fibronectin binding protein [Streptococcus pyogenes ABC020037757]HEP6320515.1 fibronectin binding prot
MTKKFIKSAVILGLASITISMTQPVEAISNSLEYQAQYKRVKEELDALKEKGPKLGERSLYFKVVNRFLGWFGVVWDPLAIKETDHLLDLIGQVNYLVSNTEFQAPEYQKAKNKLDLAVAGYDLYLAREKKRGDAPDYQVTQLTLGQLETIKTKIQEALKTFAQEVKTIQQKKPDLFPHAYVLNAKSKDITDKAQPFLVNGYYDVFYKQFLFTNTNDGYNYNKEADNLASYQKLIKELLGLKAEIDQLTKDDPKNDRLETLMWESKFTLSDSRRTSRLSAYYTQEDYVKKVVLSEEAPNLRTAKEKVKTLKGILHDYYVDIKEPEKAKKYRVEDETLPSQPEAPAKPEAPAPSPSPAPGQKPAEDERSSQATEPANPSKENSSTDASQGSHDSENPATDSPSQPQASDQGNHQSQVPNAKPQTDKTDTPNAPVPPQNTPNAPAIPQDTPKVPEAGGQSGPAGNAEEKAPDSGPKESGQSSSKESPSVGEDTTPNQPDVLVGGQREPIDITEDTITDAPPTVSGHNASTQPQSVVEDTAPQRPDVLVGGQSEPIDITQDTQPGMSGSNDATVINEDTKPKRVFHFDNKEPQASEKAAEQKLAPHDSHTTPQTSDDTAAPHLPASGDKPEKVFALAALTMVAAAGLLSKKRRNTDKN